MFNITTGLTIWSSEAATLSLVLFLAWRNDRQQRFFLLWSIGFLLRSIGHALVGCRLLLPDLLSIDLGNALSFIGISAWISGFCMLDKRKADWTALLPPAIWIAGVWLPWVHDSLANRIVLFLLATAAGATLLAAAARPVNGGRPERARIPLVYVLMTLACACFVMALGGVIATPKGPALAHYQVATALTTGFLITIAIVLTGYVLVQRSQRRWRALSLNDSLTSVLNRRGLLEFFGLLKRQISDPEQRVAALLFDLDHFKSINDRYGHQAGDQVLREFVGIARASLPRGAGFGRMGGEEFMAFLTVSDQVEAEAVAENLREAFCRHPLSVEGLSISASVSVGVSLASAVDADWDRLTGAADRALYAAKGAGRNRTVVFSEADTVRGPEFTQDPHAGELVPTVDDQVEALQRIRALARS